MSYGAESNSLGFVNTLIKFKTASNILTIPNRNKYPTINRKYSLLMIEPYKKRTVPQIRSTRKTARPRARHGACQKVIEAQRLRKQGKWKQAKSILAEMEPTTCSDVDYLNEIVYVRAAELREQNSSMSASELLKDLIALTDSTPVMMTVTTFNVILVALRERAPYPQNQTAKSRSEDLQSALSVFDLMIKKKFSPDAFTMSILFQICASHRSVRHAQYFDKIATESCEFSHNMYSGSSLIAVYTKCGKVLLAEETLKRLLAKDIPVNERSYVSVISAFHRIGRHMKVLEYLNKAIASPHVTPNLFLFSGALASCCRAKDSVSAYAIYEMILEKGIEPTEEIFFSLFETAVNSGDVRLGDKLLFEWMPASKIMEPLKGRVIKLITSAKLNGKQGVNLQESLEQMINKMEHDFDIKADVATYNSLVTALIKNNLHDQAINFLITHFDATGFSKDTVSYNLLLQCYGTKGMTQEATEVLKEMKNNNVIPNAITYNILLDILVESGERDLSMSLINEMDKDPGLKLDTVAISSQLKLCRKDKNAECALQIVRKARKRSVIIDTRTYSILLTILFECRQEDKAVTLFGWLIWKHEVNHEIFNIMIDQVGRRRQGYKKSMKMFEYMKERGIAPDEITYTTMIRICAKNRQLAIGCKLLGEMQDIGLVSDSYSWTVLIDGCGRAGQWERAKELLQMMRENGGGSSVVPYPSTASYNATLYAAGMHGGGWKVVKEIYEWFKTDKKVRMDFVTYSAMASIILRNRLEVKQLDIVKEIYDELGKGIEILNMKRDGEDRRKMERIELKKLKAKRRRLDWLLRQRS